jgi:stage IV sporulation protein B
MLIYVTNIYGLPNSIVVFKGEKLNLKTIFGINIIPEENSYKAIQASANTENNKSIEKTTATVNLFNVFNVKKIEVNTIPETTVIPLGNTIGLKLYTNGVLVVGKTEINGKEPYQGSGIEEGDLIVKINQSEITCTADLIKMVSNSNGEDLNIDYIRDGEQFSSNIKPIKTDENQYKIGLWVRDGAAGIGTITYYEPSTKKFAALGHGILDIDTENLITISSGKIVTSKISSIVKGQNGTPGELRGTISNGEIIGTVGTNTNFGIYGNLSNTNILNIDNLNEMKVATRDEIQTGEAKILLTLEDNQRKEYSVKIEKIYRNNNENNKSMFIKVTDKELLEKTGGIVQRNEWSTNNTKRKIYRSCNTCVGIRPNRRICGIWGFNDKTNERCRIIIAKNNPIKNKPLQTTVGAGTRPTRRNKNQRNKSLQTTVGAGTRPTRRNKNQRNKSLQTTVGAGLDLPVYFYFVFKISCNFE